MDAFIVMLLKEEVVEVGHEMLRAEKHTQSLKTAYMMNSDPTSLSQDKLFYECTNG